MAILQRIKQRLKRHIQHEVAQQVHAVMPEGFNKAVVMKECLSQKRPVDFVNVGAHQLFMYSDDGAYSWVPESDKHQSPVEHAKQVKQFGFTCTPVTYGAFAPDNAVYHIIDHYWNQGIDFTYIDVGSQYGTSAYGANSGRSALDVARHIKACNKSQRVVAFEPGEAGELLPYNVQVNGLADIICIERMAVSFASLPSLLYYDIGHSENNRLVNELVSHAVVVSCVPLDDYIAKHNLVCPPIVKIDTQGAEPEVLDGMGKIRKSYPVTILMEFTPMSIVARIRPEAFLESLLADAVVIDLPVTADDEMQIIVPENIPSFVQDVYSRRPRYTDILVIPKFFARCKFLN